MAVIALCTDFGLDDAYVGILKGAILSVAPSVTLVDVCHSVVPFDVRGAACMLGSALPYFPRDTIFVAVVDPGVGSARRALAARAGDHFFVGPDNGLLPAAAAFAKVPIGRAVELTERRYQRAERSATFHGRDVFGPVAAHLSLGVDLAELGRPAKHLVRLRRLRGGQVILVDRFGNLVTNLDGALLGPRSRVRIGTVEVPSAKTYAAMSGPSALVGSMGLVEIAVREGSAAQLLGAGVGTKVALR